MKYYSINQQRRDVAVLLGHESHNRIEVIYVENRKTNAKRMEADADGYRIHDNIHMMGFLKIQVRWRAGRVGAL